MRGHGEGTIYRDTKGGRWMAQVSLGEGRRKSIAGRKGGTKAELIAKVRAARKAIEEGRDGDYTVADALDYFAERVLPTRRRGGRALSRSSHEGYAYACSMLRAEFGKLKLVDLTSDRIDAGLKRIGTGRYGRGKPLSERTLRTARMTLAQVLDLAIGKQWIPPYNAATYSTLPPDATPKRTKSSLTAEEARALWDGLEGERLCGYFRLLLATGMRPGEAAALRWDAVDLTDGLVNVKRNIERDNSVADKVKTTNSYRTIQLDPLALAELRAQRVRNAEAKLASSGWHEGDLVFPTENGRVWHRSNVVQELAAICERAGVQRVSPHGLRHTAISLLIDAGHNPVQVADLVGDTVETILAVYRHRVRPSVDAHVEFMGALFG